MKNKKKKLKVLATAAAMVMVMGATAATTWAFTRTNTNTGFDITVVGKGHIEATINGASYVSTQADAVETLTPMVFEEGSTESSINNVFGTKILMNNAHDVVTYQFSITNDTTKETNNLYIKPVVSIDEENENLATSTYYSLDNVTYKAMTEDVLVAHSEGTIYYQLRVELINDVASDINFGGDIQLNLYSEINRPVEYVPEYRYIIEDDNTVTRTEVCTTCGEVMGSEKMAEGSYEVITTDTFETLEETEKELSNKVFVFAEGDYSQIGIGWRTLENVVFAGEYTGNDKGVVLNEEFYIYTQDGTETVRYVNNLEFTNLAFKNRLYIASQSADIKNVNINNCTFTYELEDRQNLAAILINPWIEGKTIAENITINNCSIDGYYQGLMTYQAKNLLVTDSTFNNLTHNAIGVQVHGSEAGWVFQGDIKILNNTISNIIGETNTGERAIRFKTGENANIVIENNKFTAAVDSANEILKTSAMTNSSIQFVNNTYAGNAVENVKDSLDGITGYVIVA